MVFKCKWFDTIVSLEIRKHKSGIVNVSLRWQYEKYDPLSYLVIVIKFVSFLIRGFEAHQQTIGGHVRMLCLEGFEKFLKLLLLRYKMIHTTKLLHEVKCYALKLMLWKMIQIMIRI